MRQPWLIDRLAMTSGTPQGGEDVMKKAERCATSPGWRHDLPGGRRRTRTQHVRHQAGPGSGMVDGNTVDTLADEEISGEMALLDHGTRTASVVTLEETQLLSEWLR